MIKVSEASDPPSLISTGVDECRGAARETDCSVRRWVHALTRSLTELAMPESSRPLPALWISRDSTNCA